MKQQNITEKKLVSFLSNALPLWNQLIDKNGATSVQFTFLPEHAIKHTHIHIHQKHWQTVVVQTVNWELKTESSSRYRVDYSKSSRHAIPIALLLICALVFTVLAVLTVPRSETQLAPTSTSSSTSTTVVSENTGCGLETKLKSSSLSALCCCQPPLC